jgi:hypothetical protein
MRTPRAFFEEQAMTSSDGELYAEAIASMEARRNTEGKQPQTDGMAQEAAHASQLFEDVIAAELKKAQFALQTAHYRSRVDIPLRGPSPNGRVATLYAARGDNVSTMLQFVYSPEAMGVISAAIFRFNKGLRRKPSNWPEDVLIPIASLTLERVQQLIKTFIDALGEY